jgi:hypothetical protein
MIGPQKQNKYYYKNVFLKTNLMVNSWQNPKLGGLKIINKEGLEIIF